MNTTLNVLTIELNMEGNYTCVSTSKHGTDAKEFSFIFEGDTNFDAFL